MGDIVGFKRTNSEAADKLEELFSVISEALSQQMLVSLGVVYEVANSDGPCSICFAANTLEKIRLSGTLSEVAAELSNESLGEIYESSTAGSTTH